MADANNPIATIPTGKTVETQDEALKRILGEDAVPSDTTKKDTNRNERGQFVSNKTDNEPEDVEDSTDTLEPEDEPDSDKVNPDDYSAALKALKRDGLPTSVIDKMSDKEIVEVGLARAKAQSDGDGFGKKYKDALAQIEELKALKESDSDEDIKPHLNKISELLGDEVSEPLSALVTELRKQKKSDTRNDDAVLALANVVQDMKNESLRERYMSDFPSLKSRARFERVKQRIEESGRDYSDAGYDVAFEEACILEFHKEIVEGQRTARQESNIKRANGASTASQTKGSERQRTSEQKYMDLAVALAKQAKGAQGADDDVRKAKRAVGAPMNRISGQMPSNA